MQLNIAPPETEPKPALGNLRRAAEGIDPCAYHEVSLALVAVDASIARVTLLGRAIGEARGEECQRHFLGEYSQLVWEAISDELQPPQRPE
jgi:hypothetical protein